MTKAELLNKLKISVDRLEEIEGGSKIKLKDSDEYSNALSLINSLVELTPEYDLFIVETDMNTLTFKGDNFELQLTADFTSDEYELKYLGA